MEMTIEERFEKSKNNRIIISREEFDDAIHEALDVYIKWFEERDQHQYKIFIARLDAADKRFDGMRWKKNQLQERYDFIKSISTKEALEETESEERR